ncbi:sugar phosphate isomerase/epimerase family protein [Spirosoma utsteinense]|uniref:Sugar phosphate isomerase/epimerase n=1 Tax=Spirosoma utsteinense TaxID=2585773 RepID=A0ABR6W1T0_9BACT|nr:sugar phosphate isomerase/epimerase [Spirosoma utsteinense]MBC3785235.1 sugar phosphate isomerase/epimerase [Spirosoma utsteinense]MBC3790539.1 sugar phosphate isomerase/epimerase [Spirosoma utsteinense]
MQRRSFLKQSGLLTAGALSLSQLDVFAGAPQKAINPFGVQLYSTRDILPKDPKGVMTQLAQMGYKQFESYSGPQGFLWGMEPKEIKSFLDDMGVKMISTHFDINKDLDKSIDMANGAGLSYLLCPYIGPQKTFDDWKKIADKFNSVGEQVTKGGLKFGYHNHDYSFKPLEGKIPQEYLLANTDPKNVMFELDLCWIDVAGQDPVAHLQKYGKRYELCHIKDYKKENGKPVQNDLGKGNVDFKKTLRTAMDNGMKYFIVEQEEYPESVMGSMKNDAEYMKKLTV